MAQLVSHGVTFEIEHDGKRTSIPVSNMSGITIGPGKNKLHLDIDFSSHGELIPGAGDLSLSESITKVRAVQIQAQNIVSEIERAGMSPTKATSELLEAQKLLTECQEIWDKARQRLEFMIESAANHIEHYEEHYEAYQEQARESSANDLGSDTVSGIREGFLLKEAREYVKTKGLEKLFRYRYKF